MIWQLICDDWKNHFTVHCIIVLFADDIKMSNTADCIQQKYWWVCGIKISPSPPKRNCFALSIHIAYIQRIAVFFLSLTFAHSLNVCHIGFSTQCFAAYTFHYVVKWYVHRISFTKCQFIKVLSWVKNAFRISFGLQ